MHPKKTVMIREKELQSLLATPAGRSELHELAAQYHDASGRIRPPKSSVVTYILIHERERGLICD